MAVTIDGLFGLQQMGENVALFEQLPGSLPLQETVFESEECFGDVYRFDREDFEISLPPFVGGRKSASKSVKTQDQKVEYIAIAHIRTHKVLYSAELFTQRVPGELRDDAAATVAKARTQLRNRVKMGIERLCAMALRGSVAISPANFPDSEVTITISRAVTALTAPAMGWDKIASQIVSKDVQVWRRQMQQIMGGKLDKLMFNNSVTRYMLQNTECKDWITRTQTGVNTFEAAMFARAGGVNQWIENENFYKPEGGAATTFVSDNEVFALPPDPLKICRLIEGYGEIPVEAIGVGGPAGTGAAVRAPAPGVFEWASAIPGGDPAGIKLGCGWYGMPLVKIPLAVGYRADVTSIA